MTRVKLAMRCLSFLVILALPTYWWLSSGTTLTVTNRSGMTIRDLKIAYDQGKVEFGDVAVGGEKTKLLGRIGQGSAFYLDFEQNNERLEASTGIYFSDLGFYRTEVFIEIERDRRVRIRNGAGLREAAIESK